MSRSIQHFERWAKRRERRRIPPVKQRTRMLDALEKGRSAWRKGINQKPGFESYYTMSRAGRHDVAASFADLSNGGTDGYLESSFSDVTRLHVRMRMRRSYSALRK